MYAMSDDLTEMDELDPCPLCGETDLDTRSFPAIVNSQGIFMAVINHRCRKGYALSVSKEATTERAAIERVIKAWNSLSKETP